MSDNQTQLTSPLDNLDSLTSATEAAAQDLVSQAAAEMDKVEVVPEVKAPEVPVPPKLSVGVTEHPISDADAAKYVAESGDFAMPVSPLDDLSDLTPKIDPVPTDSVSATEPMPIPRAETLNTVLPKLNEQKTDVIRPVESKDLEQKAKAMLNDLGPVAPKPKKRSGAVTKMALAAVLVVLMGVGGVVGVKYMNQSQENRSQAKCWPDGNGGTECGDDEAYESARRTWADEDERAQVHDAEDEADNQASCPSQSGKACSCGTYTDGHGCSICHDDCAAVAKSNQAMCGRDDCSKPAATAYNYSGDYKCSSDSYGCNWGCCKTGSGEAYIPVIVSNGATSTVSWQKIDKTNSTHLAVLNSMLEQRGIKTDSSGNFTTVMNTAVRQGMDVEREICGKFDETGKCACKEYDTTHGTCIKDYMTTTSWAKYCEQQSDGSFKNTNCAIVEGGYLSVSGQSTDGDICTPDITGGFDACVNGSGQKVSCTLLGFSRCNCGSGTWVVGAGAKDCNALCGGTGNCQSEICGAKNPDPKATPIPTPVPVFACTGVTASTESAKIAIGAPVSFTCAGSGGAVSAQFQYTIDGGTPVSIPTSTANKLKSDAVTFAKAGAYKVACRVCKADGTTCSDWGIAQ